MTSKNTVRIHRSSSIKTRFARRFLRTFLKMKRPIRGEIDKINLATGSRTCHQEITKRRSQTIKVASYASMARAVGSRRAWSRAVLYKLRKKRVILKISSLYTKKKKIKKTTKKKKGNFIKNCNIKMDGHDSLRKLVPGGEEMDVCSLLEETAHYIKCLATQVKVMQNIADYYSK